MRVTDMISITELSRLINKSRPTVYKYISDFEKDNHDDVPAILDSLFDRIAKGNISKAEIYDYLEKNYAVNDETLSTLNEIIDLLKANREKLNLTAIKDYVLEEIKKNG